MVESAGLCFLFTKRISPCKKSVKICITTLCGLLLEIASIIHNGIASDQKKQNRFNRRIFLLIDSGSDGSVPREKIFEIRLFK